MLYVMACSRAVVEAPRLYRPFAALPWWLLCIDRVSASPRLRPFLAADVARSPPITRWW